MPGGAQLTDVGARPNVGLARPHFAVVSRDTVRTVANSDYIDIHNLRNITYLLAIYTVVVQLSDTVKVLHEQQNY